MKYPGKSRVKPSLFKLSLLILAIAIISLMFNCEKTKPVPTVLISPTPVQTVIPNLAIEPTPLPPERAPLAVSTPSISITSTPRSVPAPAAEPPIGTTTAELEPTPEITATPTPVQPRISAPLPSAIVTPGPIRTPPPVIPQVTATPAPMPKTPIPTAIPAARRIAPWPMLGQNPQRTGRSPYDVPETLFIKWNVILKSTVTNSPVIDSSGVVYVGTDDGILYAIHPEGKIIWERKIANAPIRSTPAISDEGVLHVGTDDYKLYAIKPDGTIKWTFTTEGAIESSPAIGKDGTIYAGSNDRNFYAINPDGGLKWKFSGQFPFKSSPAIDFDGTIYIISDNGFNSSTIHALNADGSVKWNLIIGERIVTTPVIDSTGRVYVGTNDRYVVNYLYSINLSGSIRGKIKVDIPGRASEVPPGTKSGIFSPGFISSPIIYDSNNLYLLVADNMGAVFLVLINPDTIAGNSLNTTYVKIIPVSHIFPVLYLNPPVMGANGNILFASDYLNLVTANGTVRAFASWGKKGLVSGKSLSSPAIAADGTVYLAGYDAETDKAVLRALKD